MFLWIGYAFYLEAKQVPVTLGEFQIVGLFVCEPVAEVKRSRESHLPFLVVVFHLRIVLKRHRLFGFVQVRALLVD